MGSMRMIQVVGCAVRTKTYCISSNGAHGTPYKHIIFSLRPLRLCGEKLFLMFLPQPSPTQNYYPPTSN